MKSKRSVVAAFGALCLALGSSSWAWGPVGHEVTAQIAQGLIAPVTLEKIQTLLPGVTMADISNCADQFRDGNSNCAGVFTMAGSGPQTEPWHFLDLPVTAQVNAANFAAMLKQYCPNGDCVNAQLDKNVQILKSRVGSIIEQQQAFVNLVHFAGDIHQPMHVVTGVPNDQGGNLKQMRDITRQELFGDSSSWKKKSLLPRQRVRARRASAGSESQNATLHQTWDSVIGNQMSAQELAQMLQADLKNHDTASWLTGDLPTAAAIEGHAIAQGSIYPDYAANNGGDTLAQYQAEFQKVAYTRLQQGGVRLAHMLDSIFGGQ